jgi:hypothetical protein
VLLRFALRWKYLVPCSALGISEILGEALALAQLICSGIQTSRGQEQGTKSKIFYQPARNALLEEMLPSLIAIRCFTYKH